MTDKVLSPVYILRSYAWEIIKANTNLTEADYNGLVPIVPLSELQELSNIDKPHLVYGYSLDATSPLPVQRGGSMTFAIYGTKFREITTILDVLSHGFGRLDESAEDINRYSSREPGYTGIRFAFVSVGFVEGGTPEGSEGGRMSGLINIRFEYYADYTVITNV